MATLPHELESEEYWACFDWVMQNPCLRVGQYIRPMFEIRALRLCEEDEVRDEDCTCLL